MSAARWAQTATLHEGKYVLPDDTDEHSSRELVSFDTVHYGTLTGINSSVAVVVLTYHSGGTATWQYVYIFANKQRNPKLLAWLRTGSRADQGLREVSFADGGLVLAVNDPDLRQGDCCSAGTITTRYKWSQDHFAQVGQSIHKTDPPSFDCNKAVTPTEQTICQDAELSFLDRQLDDAYQHVLQGASTERQKSIRRQQAEWFAEYRRTCNAPLSETQRRDCIEQRLSDRLGTIWK